MAVRKKLTKARRPVIWATIKNTGIAPNLTWATRLLIPIKETAKEIAPSEHLSGDRKWWLKQTLNIFKNCKRISFEMRTQTHKTRKKKEHQTWVHPKNRMPKENKQTKCMFLKIVRAVV